MVEELGEGREQLTDAAAVHGAREEIRRAIAGLAARPLDEQVTEQMRAALHRSSSRPVREALRRLDGGHVRDGLRVVTDAPAGAGEVS